MRGFTLIELLVYVALLSIILTLSVQFVLSIIESTARMDAKEEVQKNAAAIIQTFDYAARQSRAIYDPTSDFISDPGQVSLVSSTNLAPYEDETYVDMYLDNGRFCVKWELTGVECVTSTRVEITSLTFSNIDQGANIESVQIRATLRFDSPRTEYYFTETVETSVRLRNY